MMRECLRLDPCKQTRLSYQTTQSPAKGKLDREKVELDRTRSATPGRTNPRRLERVHAERSLTVARPHSSHLLKPLDVGIFLPLKRVYGTELA